MKFFDIKKEYKDSIDYFYLEKSDMFIINMRTN